MIVKVQRDPDGPATDLAVYREFLSTATVGIDRQSVRLGTMGTSEGDGFRHGYV